MPWTLIILRRVEPSYPDEKFRWYIHEYSKDRIFILIIRCNGTSLLSYCLGNCNYHISRELKKCRYIKRVPRRVFIDERVERANFYGRADIWILTIHVHADRRRQRDRPIVIRGVASQHRVDVVPAQILYNDLAACHIVAQYRNPVGDEFVVAIPGHRRGRLTYGNTSISFQLAACQLGGKIIALGIDETRRFAEVFSKRKRAYREMLEF